MKYTYVFDDGLKVEGTVEQIATIAKTLGKTLDAGKLPRPKGYYFSEKNQGLVRIKDMNNVHIRNALLKITRAYFEPANFDKGISNRDFLAKYIAFPEYELAKDLVNELGNR